MIRTGFSRSMNESVSDDVAEQILIAATKKNRPNPHKIVLVCDYNDGYDHSIECTTDDLAKKLKEIDATSFSDKGTIRMSIGVVSGNLRLPSRGRKIQTIDTKFNVLLPR